jgi:UDP-3-O-[3-hydroxymyristoyl] glucosamine N-acyltransferase
VDERFVTDVPARVAALRVREPYRAFIIIAHALFPAAQRPSSLFGAEGIAAGATAHPTARLEQGVTVDPGVVIGAGAEIGAGSVIAANAVVGAGVRIGRQCAIGAGASLMHTLVGDRVIIHPGCRIGQDGFGFVRDGKSAIKIPQTRRVIIQDDVEIGANTVIDRGSTRDTVIGEGTKIDNLVQIGHNCVIGRHCFIVSQTGISGSVEVADCVMLGGRVGSADHPTSVAGGNE